MTFLRAEPGSEIIVKGQKMIYIGIGNRSGTNTIGIRRITRSHANLAEKVARRGSKMT